MEIKVIITIEDMSKNVPYFKTHRDYIEYRFNQMGYSITQWNWDRDLSTKEWRQYEDGIQFKRLDSVIQLGLEVTGIVGKNIRRYDASEKINETNSSNRET